MDWATITKFSAYRSAGFTASSSDVKIPFEVEEFDIGSNFDTTNNRFIAPVDGYYQFNAAVTASAANNGGTLGINLRKNNTLAKAGSRIENIYVPSGTREPVSVVSALLYLTAGDYVEAFMFSNNLALKTGASNTYFQGFRAG